MVTGLIERWRAGQRVTLIDKIATVGCLAELDGMCAELSARGCRLGEAERAAVARRRVELQEGGRHAG